MMSNDATTTTAADPASTNGDAPPDLKPLHDEAARHRLAARDAQAEAARLAGIVQSYQRRDVEAVAHDLGLGSGSDVWLGGADLGQLVNAEGQPDRKAIQTAVAGVIAEHPNWRRTFGSADQGARTAVGDGLSDWLRRVAQG
jgi:hypothetical protein